MQKISLLGGLRIPQTVECYIKELFINDKWLINVSQKNISSDGQCVNTLATSTYGKQGAGDCNYSLTCPNAATD